MTKLEHAIADAARLLDSLQIERDGLAGAMATTTSDVERAFCETRLVVLEGLVADAKRDLEAAQKLRFSLAFSGVRYRRQLKVPLRVKDRERKRA